MENHHRSFGFLQVGFMQHKNAMTRRYYKKLASSSFRYTLYDVIRLVGREDAIGAVLIV